MLDPRQAETSFHKATNLLASALTKREGEIPDFVREKDMVRLLASYTNNMLRAALLKPHIDELMANRDLAVLAGDSRSARWLNNLASDIIGVRQGTLGAWTKEQIGRLQTNLLLASDRAAKAGHTNRAALLEWAADKPNFFPTLMNQVYPNYLGWNPHAWVANLSQPYTTTLPELGYVYGTPRIFEAQARVVGEMRKAGGLGGYKQMLEGEGLLKPQIDPELYRLLRGTVERSWFGKLSSKALELNTKAAMAPFEMTEVVNRGVTRELGHIIAGDLLGRGSDRARQSASLFLKNAGGFLEREANKLASAGDEAGLQKLLGQYLSGKTMFNYDRATMSEWGRFAGPLLSTFSKWPASVAGDIYEQFARRGAVKGSAEVARKYVAPLMGLWALDKLLPDPEDNSWTKLAFGKGGLRSSAPLTSVVPLVSGDMFQPPIVQVAKSLFADAAKGNAVTGAWKAANNALAGFAPGAVLGTAYARVQEAREGEPRKGTYLQRLSPDRDLDDRVKEVDEQIKERFGGE
jgi:hypothetical protein